MATWPGATQTGPPTRLREDLAAFLHERVLPARAAPAPPDSAMQLPAERFAGAYAFTVGCFTCEEGEGWGVGWQEIESPEPGVVTFGGRRWRWHPQTVVTVSRDRAGRG